MYKFTDKLTTKHIAKHQVNQANNKNKKQQNHGQKANAQQNLVKPIAKDKIYNQQ